MRLDGSSMRKASYCWVSECIARPPKEVDSEMDDDTLTMRPLMMDIKPVAKESGSHHSKSTNNNS